MLSFEAINVSIFCRLRMGNILSRPAYSSFRVRGQKKQNRWIDLEALVDKWWRSPEGVFMEVLLLAKKFRLEDICLYQLFLKKIFCTNLEEELKILKISANSSFFNRTNKDLAVLSILTLRIRFDNRSLLGEPSFDYQHARTVVDEILLSSDSPMGKMRALLVEEISYCYTNFFYFWVVTPIPLGLEGLQETVDYFIDKTRLRKLVFKKKNKKNKATIKIVQDCVLRDNNKNKFIMTLTWQDDFKVQMQSSSRQMFKVILRGILREPLYMTRLLFCVQARQCCDSLSK